MGLYADWLALCEQPRPDAAQQEYWDRYFAAETENVPENPCIRPARL